MTQVLNTRIWTMRRWPTLIYLAVWVSCTAPTKSQDYLPVKLPQLNISPYCTAHVEGVPDRQRHQSLTLGAVLTANATENQSCIVTFQAESVLQRFNLRFLYLSLGCDSELSVYDGDVAVGKPKRVLSCRQTAFETRAIIMRGHSVTLKYTTGNKILSAKERSKNGFRVMLHVFKSSPPPCEEFTCGGKHKYCLTMEFVCDGIEQCEDGSDESYDICRLPDRIIDVDAPMMMLLADVFAAFRASS